MVKKKEGKLKKLENEDERMATFNRLRDEIFKEAAELSEIEGFQVAIAGFTPKGEPFAFDHPSTGKILDRFLQEGDSSRNVQLFRGSSKNSSQVEKRKELEYHLGQENQNEEEDNDIMNEFQCDATGIDKCESLDEPEAMKEDSEQEVEVNDKQFAEKISKTK